MMNAMDNDTDPQERREQLQPDALARWTAYENSGLHVSAAEADEWLDRLQEGETVPAPAAHR